MTKAKLTKEELIKYIEEMPVLELAELVKDLEDRFGVTAAPMAVAAVAADFRANAADPFDRSPRGCSLGAAIKLR